MTRYITRERLTNYGAPQSDISAKVDVTSNCEVIELNDFRNLPEPFLELCNLQLLVSP